MKKIILSLSIMFLTTLSVQARSVELLNSQGEKQDYSVFNNEWIEIKSDYDNNFVVFFDDVISYEKEIGLLKEIDVINLKRDILKDKKLLNVGNKFYVRDSKLALVISTDNKNFLEEEKEVQIDQYKFIKVFNKSKAKEVAKPKVVSTFPANKEVRVPLTKTISMKLNKDVDQINKDKIKVYDGSYNELGIFSFWYVEKDNEIKMQLKMKPETTHSITFEEGALIDEYGNKNERYSFSFYTKEIKPLKIKTHNLMNEKVELDKDIKLVFNKEVEKMSKTGIYRAFSGKLNLEDIKIEGKTVTFIPENNLASNNEYTFNFEEGTFVDKEGASSEPFEINFETIEKPNIYISYPEDNAKDVNQVAPIGIIFNGELKSINPDKVEMFEEAEEIEINPYVNVERKMLFIDEVNLKANTKYKIVINEKSVVSENDKYNDKEVIRFKTQKIKEAKDLKGHWAKQDINKLREEGILSIYNDGTVKPKEEIVRGDAAILLTKGLNLKRKYPEMEGFILKDINVGHPLAVYINTAKEYFDIKEDKFDVYNEVTREEFINLLIKASNIEVDNIKDISFNDKEDINKEYLENIKKAYTLDIVAGDKENNLNPKKNITIAEAAIMLNNIRRKIK